MKYDFTNRVVVLTWSSRWLGKNLTLILASLGSQVIINGKDKNNLQQTSKEF